MEARRIGTATELGDRIEIACDLAGGKKKLADMAGVSESQLHRYIAGTSQPTISPLVAIALAGGVRFEWLATGCLPAIRSGTDEGRAPESPAALALLREFARFWKRHPCDGGLHEALRKFVDSYNSLSPEIERIAGKEFVDLAEVSELIFVARASGIEVAGKSRLATPRDDDHLSLPLLTALLVAMDCAGLSLKAEERANVLVKAHSIIQLASEPGIDTLACLDNSDLVALIAIVSKLSGHDAGALG